MAQTIKNKEIIKPTKWEVIYEDEEGTSIWKYDTKKSITGPFEVEYRFKKSFNPWSQGKKKTLGDLAKETKKKSKLQGT
jgi:hypothetical protein